MNPTNPVFAESEAELASALEFIGEVHESTLSAVVAYDRELRILYWNAVTEIISGIPGSAARGRSAYDLFPMLAIRGEDQDLLLALDGRHQSGRPGFFAAPHDRSGRFTAHHAPLHGRDGRVLGGLVVARDRQASQSLVEQLRETEARFRIMADCAPVLLWMSGTDGLCHFFNQTWLSFTGRTLEQERGFGWCEGVHPEDFQECMDLYMRSFAARQPFEMVYRLRRHDREFRWILDSAAPRFMPGGEFAGYIGSCIDITDRKDAEDALKRSAERLARTNGELERFAYAASHDLQEPLRIVANYCELLLTRYAARLDEPGQSYLQRASDAAKRLRRKVDDLLSYARLGAEPGTRLPVDMNRACRSALDVLQGVIEEAQATVHIAELPTLTAIEPHMVELVQNLVSNAIRFRRAVPPEIRISARRDGQEWVFCVEDNGIGIDPAHWEQIFRLFARLHPREATSGTGIGLALCKKIVEQHGGRMWLDSEPGVGTRMHFSLPAA